MRSQVTESPPLETTERKFYKACPAPESDMSNEDYPGNNSGENPVLERLRTKRTKTEQRWEGEKKHALPKDLTVERDLEESLRHDEFGYLEGLLQYGLPEAMPQFEALRSLYGTWGLPFYGSFEDCQKGIHDFWAYRIRNDGTLMRNVAVTTAQIGLFTAGLLTVMDFSRFVSLPDIYGLPTGAIAGVVVGATLATGGVWLYDFKGKYDTSTPSPRHVQLKEAGVEKLKGLLEGHNL